MKFFALQIRISVSVPWHALRAAGSSRPGSDKKKAR